jgi:protein bicaudal D
MEYFKTEIERLNKELQQTSCDKIRAAEYGLAVLEEKQTLQEQYDELETVFENTKQELENSKEVRIMTGIL